MYSKIKASQITFMELESYRLIYEYELKAFSYSVQLWIIKNIIHYIDSATGLEDVRENSWG